MGKNIELEPIYEWKLCAFVQAEINRIMMKYRIDIASYSWWHGRLSVRREAENNRATTTAKI